MYHPITLLPLAWVLDAGNQDSLSSVYVASYLRQDIDIHARIEPHHALSGGFNFPRHSVLGSPGVQQDPAPKRAMSSFNRESSTVINP